MEQFQVNKQDLNQHTVVEAKNTKANVDGITLEVERFAFTANNLTYYMVGDKLGYWRFFPPINNEKEGAWGVIPVWGIGKVIASSVPEVEIGHRYFGYFPPASQLHMEACAVSPGTLIDTSKHRLSLPQGYNLYRRIPSVDKSNTLKEDLQMLLWPLYITSYCLWDVVDELSLPQSTQIIILSASSKTSLGLAYALRDDNYNVVGVTSSRNKEFVSRLNVYDTLVSYDDINDINDTKTVVIDMSGNGEIKTQLVSKLGDELIRYIHVGITHWQDADKDQQGDFFFAPERIQRRMKQWGADVFHTKSSDFIEQAIVWSSRWLKVKKQVGLNSLNHDFDIICRGEIPANEGLIYSPN